MKINVLIFALNIDCGCSIEPIEHPQSVFLSQAKKINVYPPEPHFPCIKWGSSRVFITRTCLPNEIEPLLSEKGVQEERRPPSISLRESRFLRLSAFSLVR